MEVRMDKGGGYLSQCGQEGEGVDFMRTSFMDIPLCENRTQDDSLGVQINTRIFAYSKIIYYLM